MPGQNKRETFVLKHRLAGAAILIGFAVIVLPMLLGGPQEAYEDQGDSETGGGSNTKVFRSNITPIGGATPIIQAQQGDVGNEGDSTASRPGSPPPANVDDEATENVDNGAAGERRDATPETGDSGSDVAAREDKGQESSVARGWIVQVGVFKNPGNVKSIVGKLEKNGFAPSTTEVDTAGSSATRVWVGPFETRVEAARNKTRVKQKTGSEGLIVAYP